MDQTLGIFSNIPGKSAYKGLPYIFNRMDDLKKAEENNANEAERLDREKAVEQERMDEERRTEEEKK